MNPEPRYVLIPRSERCATPALLRLRRLLKFLSRTFAFLCKARREAPPETAAEVRDLNLENQ
jgi:hypothetical protein